MLKPIPYSIHNLNLLDLPECILRKIFKSLGDETVYFTMSNTCQKIRKYAKDYVELKGRFLDNASHGNLTHIYTIYILKRYDEVFTIQCKLLAWLDGELGTFDFGTVIDDKIIVGQCGSLVRNSYSNHRTSTENSNARKCYPSFMGEVIKAPFESILYEFDPEQHTWTRFPANPIRCHNPDNLVIPPFSTSCFGQFGSSNLLLLVCHYNNAYGMILLDLKINHTEGRKQYKGDYHFLKNIPEIQDCIVSIVSMLSQTEILIVGKYRQGTLRKFIEESSSNTRKLMLWKGTLEENTKEIKWKSLEFDMDEDFNVSLCFRLKNILHIIGDNFCHIFDIVKERLYKKVRYFPYRTTEKGRVFTDAEETFALILYHGIRDGRALIFTEKRGFEMFCINYEGSQNRENSWKKHCLLRLK